MESTREKLRAAGLALFAERGYRRTTIADLEAHAGLAPRAGGFYRHFESKEALLAEIVAEDLIERPGDLGFEGLLPLGDTRAELILIARGYLRAGERQAPLLHLRGEVVHLPRVEAAITEANERLLEVLMDWFRTKPGAEGVDGERLVALGFVIFGGWLFYLTKRGEGQFLDVLGTETMLESWADWWAPLLDTPGAFAQSPDALEAAGDAAAGRRAHTAEVRMAPSKPPQKAS